VESPAKITRSWRRTRVAFSLCYLIGANVAYFLGAVFLGIHKLLDAMGEDFDQRSIELEAE
jgi:hypothetical protein